MKQIGTFLFLNYTVKKSVARQFRKPHLAHKEPHMAHKEPHVDQESDPHVALCEPCVARCEPRVAHISKFSVESDLYMIHTWIIYKFLEIMLLEKRNNYILTKLTFLFFH